MDRRYGAPLDVPYDLVESTTRRLSDGYRRMWEEHSLLVRSAPGASHNHQAWPGGYRDHLEELFGLHRLLRPLWEPRVLPPDSVDLVLACHDIEKPFKYVENPRREEAHRDPTAFKDAIMREYGIRLDSEERAAYENIHFGTVSDTASLVHACDVLSARLWSDEPRASGPLSLASAAHHDSTEPPEILLHRALSAGRPLLFDVAEAMSVMRAYRGGPPDGLSRAGLHALRYIDGEGDDYRKDGPVMSGLGAFCHVSALLGRVRHDRSTAS